MKEFWNERYQHAEYAYGKEPNVFLKESLIKYPIQGRALFPADGEGRNSVFTASIGFETYAFDISEMGLKKALKLALENDVSINYQIGALHQIPLQTQNFDLIGLIYAHFPPDILLAYHHRFIKMLNPGGLVILEGFSKNHWKYRELNPAVGGPQDASLLFSVEEIAASFNGLITLELEELVVDLQEGRFHSGTGSVVRYVGRKPA
jgi:hypothetical protein